jgi:hypothetical protein
MVLSTGAAAMAVRQPGRLFNKKDAGAASGVFFAPKRFIL